MVPPIVPSQLSVGQPAASLPIIEGSRTPLFIEPEVRHDIPSETSATSALGTKPSGHPPPPTLDASNGPKFDPFFVHVAPLLNCPSTSSPRLCPPIRLRRGSQEASDISGSSFREEFRGTILENYPIVDFIKRIWSVIPTDIPLGGYMVRPELQKLFRDRVNKSLHTLGSDIKIRQAFNDMLNDLVTQVAQYAGLPKAQTLMDLYEEEWDELGLFGVFKNTERLQNRIREKCVGPFEDEPLPRDIQESSPVVRPLHADEILPISKIHQLFPRYTVRSYVSGFSVLDREVTLWYADRMGIVKSVPFNLFTQFDHLILLAVALRNPVPTRFGVSPFVAHFWENGPLSYLTLPPPHVAPAAADCNGLYLGVIPDGNPWNERRVIGRGTMVVPVAALNWETMNVCGRGPLVIKHAWPHESAPKEDNIIRIIRQRIKASDHPDCLLPKIVEVKASYTFKIDDARYGLPRASMDLRNWHGVEERVCRILIMEQYQSLVSVRNSYEFEQVYYDALYASDWVFCVAGVLHCDISINNIMYRRKANGFVEGVLCDWDLSLDTMSPKTSSYLVDNIVGTSPFMSIDRLLARYPSTTFQRSNNHRQEHDLESFFYLLVLFVATRSNKDTEAIYDWYDGSYLDIAEAKRDFLCDIRVYNAFFPADLGDYQRFIEVGGLIPILREKWRDVYVATRRVGMMATWRAQNDKIPKDILGAYSLYRGETQDKHTKV